MRTTVVIFGFIFLVHCLAAAQDMAISAEPDTTLNLNDVTIYSTRISKFAKGQGLDRLDSLTRSETPNGTLADIIPSFTSSYIRNYGPGTLSTISIRGTSANHSALLWNGIRLSPPNIGYIDLSLIQGNYFNDISVLHGGASPMFGSGSIGASIHLENKPVFGKKGFDLAAGISAGSFGMISAEGNGEVYRNKFYSRTAFSVSDARNDFSYENFEGQKENLAHAAMLRGGFMQDFGYQVADNQYLMASAWFQYAERDIPPTMSEDSSLAVQLDRSWRTMLVWKDFNPRNYMEAKLAYFNEFTRYTDPVPSVYSVIKTQSVAGSFESTWETGKNGAVFAGTQLTYEYADLLYYNRPEDQENLAVYASYKQNVPVLKWEFSLNGRQEFFTGYQSPFLFSVGGEGKIWKAFSGSFSVSRNFRAPTLNERFWVPGGNPDLAPEKSWNEEAGISFDKKFDAASTKLGLTFYNSRVENWILWLPVTSSYWQVENAQEVWSRGIEVSGNQTFNPGAVGLFIGGSYTLSKSTNEKKLFDLDASYKKQLIYTPLHRFIARTGALYKGFSLVLKGTYTGEVNTTKDNSGSLPAFFLLDAVFSKSFKLNHQYPFTIQLNANNILNKEYQVTPYRPMPGFNFLVTLRLAVSGH
jgi:iron complex outermembrane receptor protein